MLHWLWKSEFTPISMCRCGKCYNQISHENRSISMNKNRKMHRYYFNSDQDFKSACSERRIYRFMIPMLNVSRLTIWIHIIQWSSGIPLNRCYELSLIREKRTFHHIQCFQCKGQIRFMHSVSRRQVTNGSHLYDKQA